MNDARPVPRTVLSKSRVEAFSDGVFSIAATLLVLDIKVPELAKPDAAHAVAALLAAWPNYLAYVTSFLVVGLIWINHHQMFHAVDDVDRTTVVLNLVLLLSVSFIAYPTALIARYGALPPIVVTYGLTFALTGVIYNVLFEYIKRRYDLQRRSRADAFALRLSLIRQIAYPVLYASAALIALVDVAISIVLYALIPIVYLFPSPVEWQITRR